MNTMLPTLKQNTESNDYCYVMLDDFDAIMQVSCSINKKNRDSTIVIIIIIIIMIHL